MFRLTQFLPLIIIVYGFFFAHQATAQTNFGAVANGNWNNAATWTPSGGPPLTTDNAHVGSNFPTGSAASATVSLTGNHTINRLVVGRTTGNNGTLNLNGNTLLATTIILGEFGGTGQINQGGGHFETTNLTSANGNSLNLVAADRILNATVLSGGSLTTSSLLNIATNAFVENETSTLNLGANLALTGELKMRGSGNNAATVNAGGFAISASTLRIGQFGGRGELLNDGAIAAVNLEVSNSTFALDNNDVISTGLFVSSQGMLSLDATTVVQNATLSTGGTMNTVNSGNVSNSIIIVDEGSTLNMGADVVLGGDLVARGSGNNPAIINANGFNINANTLRVGQFGSRCTLLNDGAITVSNLEVSNSTLTLDNNDVISTGLFVSSQGMLSLDATTAAQNATLTSGGTMNTVHSGNLSNFIVLVDQGTTLNLGADVVLGGDFAARGTGNNPAIINANGFNINANTLRVGQFGSRCTLLNDGAITASNLEVSNSTFTLDNNDVISTSLFVNALGTLDLDATTAAQNATVATGGTLNTVSTGNLSNSMTVVDQGSTLNLGADLLLAGAVSCRGTGNKVATIEANGFDIIAGTLNVGQFDASGSLLNDGAVIAGTLIVDNSDLALNDGNDVVSTTLRLETGSVLAVQQADFEQTGLTLDGNTLQILDSSVLDLRFDLETDGGIDWAFRWANPVGGDRVDALTTMIAGGQITISAPFTVQVFNCSDGYTYVGFSEPYRAVSGQLLEGISQVNDYSATCLSDDVYWGAHGATFAFAVNDPVTQFELCAKTDNLNPSTIQIAIEAKKQAANANLILVAQLYNWTTEQYQTGSLPGTFVLTTNDSIRTLTLTGVPSDFVGPPDVFGNGEVCVRIQTIQASGAANVRTLLDQVLFVIE